jgi:hypothetical protein
MKKPAITGNQTRLAARGNSAHTQYGVKPDLWMMDFNCRNPMALVADPTAHSSHARIKP